MGDVCMDEGIADVVGRKFERLLKVANSLFMLLSTCCCKSLLKTLFIALSIG